MYKGDLKKENKKNEIETMYFSFKIVESGSITLYDIDCHSTCTISSVIP